MSPVLAIADQPPDRRPSGIAERGDLAVEFCDFTALFGPEYRPVGPIVEASSGFSGAGVMRAPTAAGTFALRRWPAVPPPRARLEGLHALLAHVRAVDPKLPIAAPVATRTGETLFAFGDRLAQLEPWRSGEPLSPMPTPAQIAAAGVTLARFHAAAESFQPAPAARPYFAAAAAGTPRSLQDRREMLRRWLAGEGERAGAHLRSEPPSPFCDFSRRLLAVLASVGPALASRLDAAAQRPVPLLPVLRDVHREHLLMTGDRVTGLIDPAAALADSPAADLARLAGSLVPAPLDPLIAAYRTVRPLSEAEAWLAGALHDSGSLLSGLAWVARGTWERRPDARDPAALDRLAHYAAAADRLVSPPKVFA